ncbi:MAG TPA: cytochrome c-type biogenesis protein [Rhizomicrobium sp.]|nr:cytochrome c-type biogenesis protein [Rhizomicrobium sp.]
MKTVLMKAVLVFLLAIFSALVAPSLSRAQPPDTSAVETFSNPALEARARNLQRQLRCLVCQGESIDESGSPFAADVRHLVRQQIAAGKSDRQIQDFLVARYGDFILMKPPLQPDTWLLWLAPFLVLGVAGSVAWITVKKAAARGA